jgi:hypothetical protein
VLALVALLALLAAPAALAPPAGAVEPFAVLGLRSGASRAEVQAVFPQMLFEEVPYIDPRVGDLYRILYGGLAILQIEGRAVVQRGPLDASLRVTLTGDRALYQAEATVLEQGVDCEEALPRLRERYGRPALGGDIAYTLWREAQILYATQLEFRCLDPGRGLYVVTLNDPFRQRPFMKSLARRLQPALEETLMVLR